MRKLILIASVLFLVGLFGVVEAQQAWPQDWGDNFETAIKLEPGDYKDFTFGTLSEDESRYYAITIKPGQKAEISADISCAVASKYRAYDFGLVLYNKDRSLLEKEEMLVDCNYEESTNKRAVWLATAEEESNDYYLRLGAEAGDGIKVDNFSFSLTDYFDASRQTDAGGSLDNPMSIEPGSYTGYLGVKDEADYYKLDIDSEITLTAKVTPPSNAALSVTVYGKDKAMITREYPQNAGAIVTNVSPIVKGGDVFLAIKTANIESGTVAKYDLDVSTEAGIKEELTGTETGYPEDWMEDMEKASQGAEKWFKRGIVSLLLTVVLPFVIGLIVLIGIIVVVVVVIKKRKNSSDSGGRR